jgi:hypothetical protein
MPLIHRNHVVEQVAAAASDPALGHSILPRTACNAVWSGTIPIARIAVGTSKP